MPKYVQIRDTVLNKTLVRTTATARELMGLRTAPGRYVPVGETVSLKLRPIVHEPVEEVIEPEAVYAEQAAAEKSAVAPVAAFTALPPKPKRDNRNAIAAMHAANAKRRADKRAAKETASAAE